VLAKLAGRCCGPGYRPPGTKAKAAGLTSPWTATPRLAAARGPLTRPPCRRPRIAGFERPFGATSTLRLSSDYNASRSNCPCVSPGDAGHASISGSILSNRVWGRRLKVVTPSPPTPAVDRFGCASPRVAPRRRPPTGTASSPQRASSRSYPACPDTLPHRPPAPA
jgi:hypothetical protein